ncbi:MAG TPA: CDP-diacylglycerol--glycerol-3-phosphate 3-phosphatidyltransferase [Thermodesulfovibrio thiophilus]|uniref:CDP-diacylglycerol--glycerol-3-phosphate 3-phosphatidyltransferase n=1 Tax=Thermodesulfovibrio thiophilus TaxID=340095 RepID=UPI00048C9540|nr:CDP-diacylglycerol--glycerol-3-phosphate 3-phosphatidyltransferase [Thermodesulfovibrio thiophilus]HQA03570.1 CDP-diacylglycerol--glycerol-3-phosphate 3-phosphatidyltransferase [Thermodesulfovibrio thiophilus]HQD36326.1 CDP-diacylglycerol--glycerol-3-phosphate 3-phosphatidyltransferase [Thermodesulfovibrio thiophilus]
MNTKTLNLPTSLTILRIIIIPVFIMEAPTNPQFGAFLFFIASVTDFLDGYLARKFKQITNLGIILDPIADKLLVISALIILVDIARVPAWIAIVIILREFIITVLRFYALSRGVVIPAEKAGKAKTVLQMISILLLLIAEEIYGVDLYDVGVVLIYIATFISVTSGIQYIVHFWRHIK